MSLHFQRTFENFTCGHCGRRVVGDGYTNHCPMCLWSKHVDVHPGDRAADCGGMMEPVGLEVRGNGQVIFHRCTVCGYRHKTKAAASDDRQVLITLSAATSGTRL